MGCNFRWTITGALTEEVTFGKGLRERRGPASLAPGGACSPEESEQGTVSAKALRWKCGQHVQEQQDGQWGSGGMTESSGGRGQRGEGPLGHVRSCRSLQEVWFLLWV